MAAIAGKAAAIYATSAASTAFTNQAMTVAGDFKTCTITSATYRYWDSTVAPTVQTSTDSGATWQTAAANGYTVQNVGGIVVFAAALAVGEEVRASGDYYPVAQIGEAHEWTLDVDADTLDATVFGDSWKEYQQGLRSATATIKRYYVDDYFVQYLSGPLVLVLYVDAANKLRYEGYARLKKDAISAAIKDLIGESLDLDFDGQVYYATT
ncbi:MAG: hypothetical protein KGL39_17550 [Patescibacteria group bacterium]|nr:hypothetical protein [Patescibacteria group bacterium]